MDSLWADVFFAREHPCPELWIMGGPLAAMDRFNVKVRESDLFGQNKSSAAIIREVCAEYDLPVPVKESPAPTLVNVTCPKCGHEKPINPVTQQPIKDAQGRRFAETTCPACGATFKAQLPATPESMQSSAGDLGGGVYLSEIEAARHP
jgi:DNA-directed RNA polymerase subunit M/transcription elongation factor TFIIS